jgi:hypothetical protein
VNGHNVPQLHLALAFPRRRRYNPRLHPAAWPRAGA